MKYQQGYMAILQKNKHKSAKEKMDLALSFFVLVGIIANLVTIAIL